MQMREELCQAGFYMKTVEEFCEHFAIIDQVMEKLKHSLALPLGKSKRQAMKQANE